MPNQSRAARLLYPNIKSWFKGGFSSKHQFSEISDHTATWFGERLHPPRIATISTVGDVLWLTNSQSMPCRQACGGEGKLISGSRMRRFEDRESEREHKGTVGSRGSCQHAKGPCGCPKPDKPKAASRTAPANRRALSGDFNSHRSLRKA